MTLTNSDIAELIALRRDLHRSPEVSGQEAGTARRIVDALTPLADEVITRLGGHGVAAVFVGAGDGPTVLFRCELDALPIAERSGVPHASEARGVAHLCGHDGHMAILAGLGRLMARQRPARGRVVLLFQPAEETGAGAADVIADANFDSIAPDYAFALHNRPGLPLGHVGLTDGPIACASRGMRITFRGKEAHASEPENGTSPMPAMADLMPALAALSRGALGDAEFRLATVTHARLGEPAFGIAPGDGEVWVTLRTLVDAQMDALCTAAEALAQSAADAHGLVVNWQYEDVFLHSENHPEATQIAQAAVAALGMSQDGQGCPMRASEDFGRFGHSAKAAMLYLGSGEVHPALHNSDYDFPDDLIAIGARIFDRIARDILG
ncbi:amidohydrolase [Pseudoprimorskyibacter insulae]|uniref:Putative hydrolase YxeP n=1 Tax=Pseudoprimorskyibacter insulae TaxID=1695997 RepID=A0A2R8AUF9_9RHOB|nr:amidohydrolase [Pseudoprimorskyibacter insulae]SPF79537.1 putative hydrolase YxeP [Pseudoprimorskyibacter insulae]